MNDETEGCGRTRHWRHGAYQGTPIARIAHPRRAHGSAARCASSRNPAAKAYSRGRPTVESVVHKLTAKTKMLPPKTGMTNKPSLVSR
jgi:hypothetical protein